MSCQRLKTYWKSGNFKKILVLEIKSKCPAGHTEWKFWQLRQKIVKNHLGNISKKNPFYLISRFDRHSVEVEIKGSLEKKKKNLHTSLGNQGRGKIGHVQIAHLRQEIPIR